MRKRMITLLWTVLLLCMTSVNVWALDVPEPDRSGSITVTVEDDGVRLSSGSLTFYQVGEIVSVDGDHRFALTGAFAACEENLEDLHSPELAKRLRDYAEKEQVIGDTRPLQDGIVRYDVAAGRLGLYLVTQQQAAEGYRALEPFLVTVPLEKNGVYVYEVDATPKVGPITALPPVVPEEPSEKPLDPVLPQTGQAKLPVPVMAVAGLCLISAGLMARLHEKKERYEK